MAMSGASSQALEGKWDQIAKGRDHLAPVELNLAAAAQRGTSEDGETPGRQPRTPRKGSGRTLLDSVFGTF